MHLQLRDSVLRQPAADPGAADRRAILESYVTGPEARRLGALSHDDVVAHTLRHLEAVHPAMRPQGWDGYGSRRSVVAGSLRACHEFSESRHQD